MDIDVFPADELPTAMRTLRTALAGSAPLAAPERAFLATYAGITGYGAPIDGLAPLDARAVQIAGAHPRKRLIQLAALAVLLGRPVKSDSFAFLQSLARHLATHDPVIRVIDALRRGQHLKVRLLTMRRLMRSLFKEAWQAEGCKGVLRFAGALFLKLSVNQDQLWRYKRLGLLPEGTLGREYWKHMTTVGFAFPGEPAGIPVPVSYHDIAHVLAEHEANGLGEIQQGSFQAGNRREDGFMFVQFVVLHFHHGVRIALAAPPEQGHFDPEKVLWAIHRGARCNVDMTHQWDYWPLMALPLAEARARCALLPKPASAPGGPSGPGVGPLVPLRA
jgi:hypothetical protein